ncbi:unnamed protein product, partial [Iphiclides podalirius]
MAHRPITIEGVRWWAVGFMGRCYRADEVVAADGLAIADRCYRRRAALSQSINCLNGNSYVCCSIAPTSDLD